MCQHPKADSDLVAPTGYPKPEVTMCKAVEIEKESLALVHDLLFSDCITGNGLVGQLSRAIESVILKYDFLRLDD